MVRALAVAFLLAAFLAPAASGDATAVVLRPGDGRRVGMPELVADLRKARVVFFGERHDSAADHDAQRALLEALRAAGTDLAIGMEMFRDDAQPALDRWVEGALDERSFRGVYDANWTPQYWELYRPILELARRERIPVVGLNIPTGIVDQVAARGFSSLSEAQRRRLGVNSCDLPERYEEVLRSLVGEKAARGAAFTNFCEAQLTWDAAMARAAADYLATHPKRTLFVLCGTFHAWRHGIPERLGRITDAGVRVVLPADDATYRNYHVMRDEADYVWWRE